MERTKPWVALLDEDEDDYVFLQHGFGAWARQVDLRWFASVPAFVSAAALGQSTPVALVMGSVVPKGEEVQWLSTLLLLPSCQQGCLIMLSAAMEEKTHQTYMDLGATDHLLKPTSLDELYVVITTVSRHIASRAEA